MRQASTAERIGSSGRRGGRRMVPGSVGSNARVMPSALAVSRLTHRICTGVRGRVRPTRMAPITARASAPLVGRVQATTFIRLS